MVVVLGDDIDGGCDVLYRFYTWGFIRITV